MHRTATILWVCLFVAAIAAPGAANDPSAASFRLSQVIQVDAQTPTLRAYLDVLDNDGEPLSVLEPRALTATVGEAAATTVGIEALAASTEGVAYIFLVDISRSLSANEFARMRGAIDLWVSSLGPADRVALIAFGEASRVELDFTNDFSAARQALRRLGPTDDLTVFNDALREGLELARRLDADLPGRRVLVVLSDGKDEGSGLTAGDLLTALRADPVPVYAIGFSRLPDSERRRSLALLNRLATNSGGAYVEAAQTSVEESYAAMLAAVRRVWVATLRCPDCRLDGDTYRLQISLSEGQRVLSDGRRVRLLPRAGRPGSEPQPAPGPTSPITEVFEPTSSDDIGSATVLPEPPGAAGSRRWWLPLLLLLLLAPAAIWWWRSRLQGTEPAWQEVGATGPSDSEHETEEPPAASSAPAYHVADGVLTSRPPKPASLRLVRLIVVRGHRIGRQYSMMLLERGVVGARSTCDCVLVEEPGVEPEQFELLQVDGRVYIRNLAQQRPTLIDGLPIAERDPLDSQTLVGNADCILRVIYDEPRRVPL